jgi:putative ABC transport system ATP-binding protein
MTSHVVQLPSSLTSNGPVVEARAVSKAYGPTPAVRDVSMTIASGEIVAVTGASGSGKSTLLHCLAGILTPDAGEVVYRGRAISALGERERSRLRRTRFGVLFQFARLVAELSAADNVALPLLLNGERRAVAIRRAHDWLDRLGVAGQAPSTPGELSGGQLQRVALARALVTEPDVLFADEPTGALDSLAGEQVLRTIVGLARERDMTVVLVTHDATVAAYADRDVVLHDGTVQPAAAVRP